MPIPAWNGATPVQPPLAAQVNQFLGMHATTPVYTGAERDNQSTAGAGSTASNGTWIAQKFTAGATYTSGRVVLTLAVTGSPGPLVVTLRPDNAGAPSATVLATVTLPNGFVTTGATVISLPVAGTITSGTVYWVVAQAVGDVSNFYSWSKSNQVTGTSTSPNGTAWTAQAYGSLFQVWDATTVPPLVHTWEDGGARWTTLITAAGGEPITQLNEYTTAQNGSYVQSAAAFTYANGLLTKLAQGAVTNTVPSWSAARGGLLGDPGDVNASAQLNQLLGQHNVSLIYRGNPILTPNGTGGGFSSFPLNQYDKSQPFTMAGTSIGRVAVPMVPFGTGADLVVSLCADNAGVPGTVITQTRVPASWFNSLAAYTAIVNTSPVQLAATGSPLATPSSNAFTMGNVVSFNFTGGTPSGGFGAAGAAVIDNITDTIVCVGGQNSAGTWVANVFTITYEGTNALANMLPQPALPIGLGAFSSIGLTTDPTNAAQYVIITGGQTGASGGYSTIANVYVSQLSGANSQMSAWTSQTALPQALQTHASAASGNYLYVTGGVNGSNQVQNTTYWANVQNGQIQSWNTGPSLPVGVYDHFTAAINGFLFVIAGYTQPGNTGATRAVWYAQINSDGTLGAWQAGPSLPVVNASTDTFFTAGSDGIFVRGGVINNGIWTLTVGPDGPSQQWQSQSFPGVNFGAVMANGPGQYYWFEGFTNASTSYNSAGFIVCPYLSIPLPATGLTNGATYHILFQQPTGATDLNNYISNVTDNNVFPGNPTQILRARGGSTWLTASTAIPLTIYDNSNNSGGPTGNDQLWHTWEDNGERISTLVYATAQDQRLLGLADATQQPGPVLNQNPTFTSGTAPWGGNNGTLVQSNAFTRGNLPFSAKFTPNGVATQGYIESELIPIEAYQQYTGTGWIYSPTGYSNCEIIINWYNASGFSGGFISSSTGATTSVPAGLWTPLSVSGFPPSANAVYGTVGLYERGTPPASAIFYGSEVAMQSLVGPMVSSVVAIDYPSAPFGTTFAWPPLGATALT